MFHHLHTLYAHIINKKIVLVTFYSDDYGRGSYLDNIFIERLWRSVKQEKIYRYDFETIEEVEQALTEYFDYRTYAKLRSLRWI